jgi:hypothetical protein
VQDPGAAYLWPDDLLELLVRHALEQDILLIVSPALSLTKFDALEAPLQRV